MNGEDEEEGSPTTDNEQQNLSFENGQQSLSGKLQNGKRTFEEESIYSEDVSRRRPFTDKILQTKIVPIETTKQNGYSGGRTVLEETSTREGGAVDYGFKSSSWYTHRVAKNTSREVEINEIRIEETHATRGDDSARLMEREVARVETIVLPDGAVKVNFVYLDC